MPASVTLKALGLNTSPNQLEVPAGSLIEAKNVVIRDNDIVSQRRGFSAYGETLGSSSDRASQLFSYQDRILRYFANKIQFDSGTQTTSNVEIFKDFDGTYSPAKLGLKIKSIESNGNLYFTSADGIQKISANNPSQFTTNSVSGALTDAGIITKAGGVKAVDLTSRLVSDVNGFLPQDSAVAYRVLWLYNDANKNLIQGTPSQRAEIYNNLLPALLNDYNLLLAALDNINQTGSLIDFGQYISQFRLPENASAVDLYNNLSLLVSQIDKDILYADQASLAPFKITLGDIVNNDLTINLSPYSVSAMNLSSYFIPGKNLFLQDFILTKPDSTIDSSSTNGINGKQTLASIFQPLSGITATLPTGAAQVTHVVTVADSGGNLAGTYFDINSANDKTSYYVWFNVSGTGLDPKIAGKTGIRVNIVTDASASAVASAIITAINNFASNDFTAANGSTTIINISNISVANPTIVTTTTPHGLASGDTITISGSNSTPSIDGPQTVTVVDNYNFSVPVNVTIAGNTGSFMINNTINITNIDDGPAIDADGGTSGFAVTTTSPGAVGNILTSVSDTTNVIVGSHVTGTGIDTNTYVTDVTFSTITLNKNVTTTGATTLTFDGGIKFNTTLVGDISENLATINDYTFESIPQSVSPGTPATDQDLLNLQTFLNQIIIDLQNIPLAVVSSALLTEFIDPLTISGPANVELQITIPSNVTNYDFFQIYRSDIAQATGTTVLNDLTPNDELKLVYEAFPTAGELSARSITVLDIVPDIFRGANLYTNEASGVGLAQAYDLPPFALDVNRYKNVTFYANTKTLQRKIISLLGVINMINNGGPNKILISDGTTTNTYTFVNGVQQVSKVIAGPASGLNSSGTANYFLLNSANNITEYYVWYSIGTATDPNLSGKIGIPVVVLGSDSAAIVAQKTSNAIATRISDFVTNITSSTNVNITNISSGPAIDISGTISGFTFSTTTPGIGENAATHQVLLSNLVSVGQAVDETARSLVSVINKNNNETVNAFYLSTAGGVPGQILLEGKDLSSQSFYVLGNNNDVGVSFSPDISPEGTIVANTIASPTIIQTNIPHGMINGDQVVIINSNSTPLIDGLYNITFIDSTHFSIPVTVTSSGSQGAWIKASDGVFSDNEQKPNRLYYSVFQQPDAVPLVNFMDVGSGDKAIIRIVPLRDSLFVFKEDGLFRISGEVSPFVTALFDSSIIVVAPDSVAVSNNMIFAWTTRGIVIVTEGGVQNISNYTINDIVKPLSSATFPAFSSATWGIGYESDNSYIVFTLKNPTDTAPQVAYRYDQITNTWTTIEKDFTCGVVHQLDDKLYVGSGDQNTIEKERKSFTRLDFADREYSLSLTPGQYFNTMMKFLTDVSNASAGDVLIQEQLLTIYQFNETLKKLDIDPGTNQNYFSSIAAISGDNLRTNIMNLAHTLDSDSKVNDTDYFFNIDTKSGSIQNIKIANPALITTVSPHGLQNGRIVTISGSNSDPLINDTYPVTVTSASSFTIPVNVDQTAGTTGSFTTIDTDFRDIQACYNFIINKMNLDSGIVFSNYQASLGTTIQESIITDVNNAKREIQVNLILPYIQGPLTVFKAIPTSITYCPITFNDPLSLKHIRELTAMFANKAFTTATMNIGSDLLPQFKSIEIIGDGNGIFGSSGQAGFGSGLFGGGSHGAPFRTYIPADKQMCIYLNIQFQHGIAREMYKLFGITLTGETGISSRGYR